MLPFYIFLLCIALYIGYYCYGIHDIGNDMKIDQREVVDGKNIESEATSGVSGNIFTGERVRTFTKFLLNPELDSINMTPICSNWAVVTTINAPTVSIRKVILNNESCVVIVADLKTPEKEYLEMQSKQVHFLSVDYQKKMQNMVISNQIPWNHFGRKNLGYLYAIQHGALVIFDFDDDNELISNIPFETSLPWLVASKSQVFNPYPSFIKLEELAWPRGFPLTQIQNYSTWVESSFITVNPRIGVIQSLANHDPDMDAIWRLTRKLPLNFDDGKRVVVPAGTYSSYNAQATIHNALWGTLLPISVHGRVSDIWRSYIMQRLMHDVGYMIGFVSPFVKQVRNSHNYQGDYMSERPLYEKTEALIQVLSKWVAKSDKFEERFVELFVELYERDFIGVKDVHLAHKWIRTLKQMNYKFPTIVNGTAMTVKHRSNNVFCLYGKLGDPRTSDAFLKRVKLVYDDADVIIVTDEDIKEFLFADVRITRTLPLLDWFNKYYPQWKTWRVPSMDNALGGLPGYQRGMGAYLIRDRSICADEIKKLELKRNRTYDTVGLTRLDLMWMADAPVVHPQNNTCWIPCQNNDAYGYCDHVAICERSSLDAYATNLLKLYPFPNHKARPIDAEGLLKRSLDKYHVNVIRGNATFFRSCRAPSWHSNGVVRCQWVPYLGMSGKPSGDQLLPWLSLSPTPNKSTNSTALSKRFVYLIQSSKPTINERLRPTANRDVLYACFKKNCDHPGVPSEDIVSAVDTSWCTGRNALVEFALDRCKDSIKNGGLGYEYYILLDDDIPDQISGADPWTMFERFLDSKHPAVGYFLGGRKWQHDSRKTLRQPFNVDANVNAFHRTTLGALLPYDCSLDPIGIYFSQQIQNMLVASLFSTNRIAGLPEIVFDDHRNRHNSNIISYNRSHEWSIPTHYFSKLFNDQKTRDALELLSTRMHDYKLCPQLPVTGAITKSWVVSNMDINHTFAKQRLDFLNKHATLLEKLATTSFRSDRAIPITWDEKCDEQYNGHK